MKTRKLMKTLLFLTATIAASTNLLPRDAYAEGSPFDELKTQSYRGKIKDGSNANIDFLVMGPIPGREESYMGFLFRERPWRADIFMVDPDDKVGYTLTPWKVARDGEMAFTNIAPTHILTLEQPGPYVNQNPFKVCADRGYEGQAFKITLAGAGNQDAIHASMVFDGTCSSTAVVRYIPGRYHQQGVPNSEVTFKPLNSRGEVDVAFAGVAGLDGVETLRRKQIGLFNMRKDIPNATGTVTSQFPDKIGFFLRNHGWFSKQDKFIVVNPENSEDIAVLERDKVQ